MSLNGDSCSTSSGCVSDMDNLSVTEDPSPDSPISDTISDSLISSTNSVEQLPNNVEFAEEFDKELLIKDSPILLVNTKVDEVAEDVDELLEEELIESEIVIDCSAEDCIETTQSLNQILINNCYELKYETRDEELCDRTDQTTDKCFPAFKTLNFSSRLVTDCAKAETASAKSDSGQTSGHESDGTRQSDSSDSKPVNQFRPILNGVFNEVTKSDDISSKSSTTSSDNRNSEERLFCCKWTNCDWPGTKDDLVDHIREIHVELQPYQQQRHNWAEAQTKTKSSRSSNSKPCADSSVTAKKNDSSQQFVCLWEGCKVYGKSSLSRNWLERHVLEQHSGPRPFKCIVEGCGQRFKVQSALERHVNSHFKPSVDFSNSNCSFDTPCQSGSNSCDFMCPTSSQQLSPFELHLKQTSRATISAAAKYKTSSVDGSVSHHSCGYVTPNKILKRKKSTQKVRRKCFYVKTCEDFFDERVMEQVRYGLLQLNDRTGIDIHGGTSTITFQSHVIARRESRDGKVNVLLKWKPNDILPDVWVPEDKLQELSHKTVPISSIPSDRLAQLIEDNDGFERKPKKKQRRK